MNRMNTPYLGDVIKEYLQERPVGKVVAFTGHRPNKIGGYTTPNPTYTLIDQRIEALLTELRPTEVISGMALGVDQYAANRAIMMSIPVTAAIPFIGQESNWPTKSQEIYNILLEHVTKKVIVSSGEYSAHKLQVRNEWMVDHCDVLIAVWNGDTSGGTYNCIQYAKRKGVEIIYLPIQ